MKTHPELPLLDAPEHVLSTLEADGSRRWLYPKLASGNWWKRRRVVAWVLIAFFVSLPHLRISGKPVVLLDVPDRKFALLGHTFLPTDTLLLALLMVGVFVTIVLATALSGRVWCGWGCPQTVYMEFLFRPIDRFFEGTKGKGGKPKRAVSGGLAAARFLVYLILCMALAHTFLAYFVGTDRLAMWVRSSPVEHPAAFLLMGGTTIAMLFDFLFFREQLCLIACPYGRFQSVMLDRQSTIVAYDEKRGEPRHKGRAAGDVKVGDCVDCHQCVVVCPTGIDIRNGLQMECINCTQCIDACDDVMDRVGRPRGLIRYSSQDALAGKPPKVLRARTIIYPILLTIIGIAFVGVLSTKYAFDANLLRGSGNPFHRLEATANLPPMIANTYKIRLTNRTDSDRIYHFEVIEPSDAVVGSQNESKVQLGEGATELIPISVQVPARSFGGKGSIDAQLRIRDDVGNERILPMKIIGPR